MTRPRLLYLLNEALFFTTHRMPIAVAARAGGFEVHVAAPYDAEPVRIIEANGFIYHPIPLDRSGRNPLAEARLLLSFWRLLGTVRPLLTHHVAMKPVAYGGLAARLRGTPAVVHAVTGLGYLFIRDNLSTRLLRGAVTTLFRAALGYRRARVIFQNRDDLALFLERGLVKRDATTLIRGTGVDLSAFAPTAEPPGPVMVMFPARLIGDKGVHEFLGAARILKGRGVTARFVLVGRTDPVNPTGVSDTDVKHWQDEGVVEWWGYRDDMAAALKQAHVVCMPSYREGLPRVLIEAAACGRPIVTADVPGCREIVHDGENGLLVPARDAAATAEALARLIGDAELRQRMGARGRAMAEAEYAVDHFVARTLSVYRDALAGVTPRPQVLLETTP